MSLNPRESPIKPHPSDAPLIPRIATLNARPPVNPRPRSTTMSPRQSENPLNLRPLSVSINPRPNESPLNLRPHSITMSSGQSDNPLNLRPHSITMSSGQSDNPLNLRPLSVSMSPHPNDNPLTLRPHSNTISPRPNESPLNLRPHSITMSPRQGERAVIPRPLSVTMSPRSSETPVPPRPLSVTMSPRSSETPVPPRPLSVMMSPTHSDQYRQHLVQYLNYWRTIPGARVRARSLDQDEDRIRRLEDEKESLSLQVCVLTEQVDAQTEKIRDMEMCTQGHQHRVPQCNNDVPQELLTRSSLEHHKLDLMAEVSHLKMRLASTEKDRRELDDRCRAIQRQVAELEAKLLMKDAENCELRLQLGRNGTLPMDSGDTEVEKLKRAVDNLVMTNEEKERKLEDLRRLLKRYRRVEEILVQAQGRKAVEELLMNIEDGDTSSNSSSTTPSVGTDAALRDQLYQHTDERLDGRYYQSSPSSTSSPTHQLNSSFNGGTAVCSIPADSRQAMGLTRSNSCENMDAKTQSKIPPFKKKEDNSTISGPGSGTGGYANTEVMTDDEDKGQPYGHGYSESKKLHGLRKLFGKLKRSSSQDFEGGRERGDDGEFRRGGVRATASARLAWNRDGKGLITNTDVPFARWDTDRVTAWMNDIGLNMYLVDCKRWVKNGEQLLRSSQHDLEKELNMKNCLHRKKLQLAMKAVTTEAIDKFLELDHNFVARWLDDIGLPQYKDSFYDARVDGRMLNYLTVEDLFLLKVSSEVHHVSIKRGIQILRLNNFNSSCLRRRPGPDEQHHMKCIPDDVVLWTNHRVMEWLRTIDLSEYAPNLRGSGVHGALMVYEPRFNSELFAILLSIPPSKTLLRRHLNTHFISLIGTEMQTKKREHESEPGYIPLLPSNKVKKGKLGLFGSKRVRTEPETETFVCPPESNGQYTNGKHDLSTKEIGAYSHEINTLTHMLSHERFLDSAKTSNV